MHSFQTHEVTNQAPPLLDVNWYTGDAALQEAVRRHGAGWHHEALVAQGALYGAAEIIELGGLANRHTPELRVFDRQGHRIDEVAFHPAWHRLMALGVEHGLHTSPWAAPREGAHVARAASCYLHNQVEAGSQCPLTMTYGCVPALQRAPEANAELLRAALSTTYDPRLAPLAQKRGALVGMGMTEKQGGSDVRSNTTVATAVTGGGAGSEYVLRGHKWFLSAPMCDAFLVLAQAPRGLSCFVLPRVLPDGRRNALRIQRLKDKLGNRSNASSEVELCDATGFLVGEEGRGVPVIIEMATYTRLDCCTGSAAMMRQAVTQAIHHARHRRAFGGALISQPLMRAVLVDLALEAEAATALAMRLAQAFDNHTEHDLALRRILTPAAKYWICKRGISVLGEAMEVLGGNGYVEEAPLARMYREMPVNSIWEGSGNVMCLDVLRAAQKSPAAVDALAAEWAVVAGASAELDALVGKVLVALRAPSAESEAFARKIADAVALCSQAALMLRHAPGFVADAFVRARLAPRVAANWGALEPTEGSQELLDRAWAPQ
jgi:putative acyl-CoA dehydrogenase